MKSDHRSSLHIQPQYKYELFHIYFTKQQQQQQQQLTSSNALRMSSWLSLLTSWTEMTMTMKVLIKWDKTSCLKELWNTDANQETNSTSRPNRVNFLLTNPSSLSYPAFACIPEVSFELLSCFHVPSLFARQVFYKKITWNRVKLKEYSPWSRTQLRINSVVYKR